jgi:Helix-turn-helix domain
VLAERENLLKKKVIELGDRNERGVNASPLTDADAVLTLDEVAAELRCSKAHVHNAFKGKIPGVSTLPVMYLGRRVLIRRSSFEQWKRENERRN